MLSVSELAGRLTGTLNRYQLSVSGRSDLDVESFSATEGLSQTYCYQITFTSGSDIAPGEMLLQDATFTFNTPGSLLGDIALSEAARSIHGVVTQFQRLSASVDEVRYQLTLEPRLALLANAGRPAIYQNQSVPEIIEQVLRQQHQFEGWQFEFRLRNSYPPREQVMQWQESDRAFIDRLLAEVGIWYRFEMDARLKREVVVFADDQQFYQFDVSLPLRSPSGMNDNGVESVWGLSSAHQVVSQSVRVKDYNYRQAGDGLQTEAEVSGGGESTYGQVYRYGDNYLTLGGESGESGGETAEGGDFYARLRHERLLNNQHQLSGKSNASTLAPGQMLEIVGGVPDSFAKGVLITTISAGARRDSSYTLTFTGIPYSETVGFRPEPEARPRIAGTLPARVTSITAGDTYAHLDKMGRYRVKFDFDLDNWKTGYESLWVRLAKPYSGDTYGMHLPLLAGTEVAIAFEEGNPDRPY
ncbi:type VI secretion system Vgr family protein, partial [Brenneria goodwinii]|uniref:type VI secretion system Vgr family protein n=1 Tax=Brenneria goodwinii TaxID=1109412 RepID=UPI001EFAA15B